MSDIIMYQGLNLKALSLKLYIYNRFQEIDFSGVFIASMLPKVISCENIPQEWNVLYSDVPGYQMFLFWKL